MFYFVKLLKNFLLFLLVGLFVSCGSMWRPTFSVGIDPTFFPLEFMNKEPYVFGFIDELLKEIGKRERVNFVRVMMNWDNLQQGLDKKAYDGMISAMMPTIPTEEKYSFSDLIIPTGPVLIMRQEAKVKNFSDLNNQEIAVLQGSTGQFVMERLPDIYMRFYNNTGNALLEVAQGVYDGATVPYQAGYSYIKNLYRGELKIVTAPLTQEGLRMVGLKGGDERFLTAFNRGLEQLRQEGRYRELLEKWSLAPTP